MTDKYPYFPSTEARKALAKRFDLPYSDRMQDWELEVTDPSRFEEFSAAFSLPELSPGERYGLAEILIHCVDVTEDEAEFAARLAIVERYLLEDLILHRSTLEYWARLSKPDLAHCFRVTPVMRRLLHRLAEEPTT